MAQTETRRHERVDFTSSGTRCAATLYKPPASASDRAGDPPVVVLANGFGLPRRFGLPRVAERFTERGLAAMTFDYRSLGESGGEPRNVVDPIGQIADWRAGIRHANTISGVDGDRIAVWGFSLGGGGAMIAAAHEDVDAYVGRTPILDGRRALAHVVRQAGLRYGLWTTVAGLRDLARKYTRREPYYVPIWGGPDELVALPAVGSNEGHRALAGDEANDPDVNRVAPRVFLQIRRFRPIEQASNVDCPALIVEALDDQLAPHASIEAAVSKLRDVRWTEYDTDHFGPHRDPLFDEVVGEEAAFLEQHLFT